MMFVAEGMVQGNSKVHWLGNVCQCSPIPADIQLLVCIPVLKMESTDLRLLWICPQILAGFARQSSWLIHRVHQ